MRLDHLQPSRNHFAVLSLIAPDPLRCENRGGCPRSAGRGWNGWRNDRREARRRTSHPASPARGRCASTTLREPQCRRNRPCTTRSGCRACPPSRTGFCPARRSYPPVIQARRHRDRSNSTGPGRPLSHRPTRTASAFPRGTHIPTPLPSAAARCSLREESLSPPRACSASCRTPSRRAN